MLEFRAVILCFYTVICSYMLTTPRSVLTDDALPHPAVWRASSLSPAQGHYLESGHPALAAELPGGGWPCGNLVELLLPRAGIGEIRLLLPALARAAAGRSVVLIQPPYQPNAVSWAAWGLDPTLLLWVRPQTEADALWAADQVLQAGGCHALLCWLPRVRVASLRRLHHAAQAGNTLFVAMRPLATAQQPSPAPLRLAIHPAQGGVLLRFVKRKGPPRDFPLHVALHAPTSLAVTHAFMDRPPSAPARAGQLVSA